MSSTSTSLKQTILASLFAALIAAGAFIAIPVGPVPIALQSFFVLLAAVVLNWRWATASILVYLLAGVLGLPVFSAGRSGLGHLLGPTGGYLISYIPATVIVSAITDFSLTRFRNATLARGVVDFLTLILGTVIIYAIGVSWLKVLLTFTWPKAISVGVLPFLVGDFIKIIVVLPVARFTWKLVMKAEISQTR